MKIKKKNGCLNSLPGIAAFVAIGGGGGGAGGAGGIGGAGGPGKPSYLSLVFDRSNVLGLLVCLSIGGFSAAFVSIFITFSTGLGASATFLLGSAGLVASAAFLLGSVGFGGFCDVGCSFGFGSDRGGSGDFEFLCRPFSFGWEGTIVILLVFLTGAAAAAAAPDSSVDASLILLRAFATIEDASCY